MKSDPESGRPRSASTPVVKKDLDAPTTGATERALGGPPSRAGSPSGGSMRARGTSDPLLPDARLRSLRHANERASAAGDAESRVPSESALAQSPHASETAPGTAATEAGPSTGPVIDHRDTAMKAMPGLLAERNRLLKALEESQHAIHKMTLANADLRGALDNAVATHGVLNTDAQLHQSRIGALTASLEQDRLVKDGLQAANNDLAAELKELRRQQTALQNELARSAALPSSVDRQEAKLETADTASALAKRLVDSTLEQLVDVRSQLKDTKHELSDTKHELDDARRDAKSGKGTIDALERKVASLDEALAGKTAELKAAMQELAQRKGKKAPNARDGNAAEKFSSCKSISLTRRPS